MFETSALASAISAAAITFYVVGFLFRNQIALRLLVICGSSCYIVYFSVAADQPLWAAMFGSSLIILANLFTLSGLLLSRAAFSVPRDLRHVRDAMGEIEPGLFRRLMRAGRLETLEVETVLTREGQRPTELFFVLSGRLRLHKRGGAIDLSEPCFIGEIAWLLGAPASATVTASPGAEIARWSVPSLRRAVGRSPRLDVALQALIAQDMARKVAAAPAAPEPSLSVVLPG